ncbi:hypothetical protein [Aliiroseovarius sediminis]|uniref:hypothetical protein n=1 Tax=Aliiroseovarius sediminis TaxID=2925839 RepID=UPI001F58A86F|nr:hypothetical protein [Aliiroseovarius sediminis]MCI2394029.1 hypothetical protein [Aliiroseovarius sediminis]
MTKTQPSYKPLNLKGSSQHHKLKNQPGEKGDEDHNKSDDTPADDLKDTVAEVEADTELAEAMRDAVEGEDDDNEK